MAQLDHTHLSIRVTGMVQGVWYRKSAADQAVLSTLSGTVRNMPDGSVLIHAQGSRTDLDAFLVWCAKGPPKAQVAEVNVEELPLQEFDGFKIER